jgi:predicted ester cyclase
MGSHCPSQHQRIVLAQAYVTNTMIEDGKARFEAEFVGKQLSEFAGRAPTGKEGRISFCVVYDPANERITQARISFETEVLRQQSS